VLDWYGRFARGRPGVLVVEATGIREVPSGPLLRAGHEVALWSNTASKARELAAAAAGVEQAQAQAVAADARAQEIVRHATRSGFTGIAAAITQVRQAITDIRTRLGAAAKLVHEAATAVTSAAGQQTPQQTIAVLTPAKQSLQVARDTITATVASVEDTKRLAATALQGGQPAPMLVALDNILQVLRLVAQRGGAAATAIDTAIVEAGKVGQGN